LLFDMIKKEETIIIKHNWPDGPIQWSIGLEFNMTLIDEH
jgi:hypothetical protein